MIAKPQTESVSTGYNDAGGKTFGGDGCQSAAAVRQSQSPNNPAAVSAILTSAKIPPESETPEVMDVLDTQETGNIETGEAMAEEESLQEQLDAALEQVEKLIV